MTDFLLELLSEEIPARMQPRAAADLSRLFAAALADHGLAAEAIETYVTPRRLALIARGLPASTPSVREERKGPRADAPPAAIEGFLRSTGLAREQLEEREDKKGGRVLFATVEKPGRPTAEILQDIVPALVRSFPWQKSMRWGEASLSTESPRWVRPLQGVVALLGDEIVPIELAGIKAGASTVGHRFHHPGAITLGGAQDYVEKLRACHVIVEAGERQRIIAEGAAARTREAGLELVDDEGLVVENAGLTEYPVVLLGSFDEAFLDVPREVIQLTMRTHQKYFACTAGDGSLAPAFLCVANIEAEDDGKAIVEGHRKVLAARLADARYFWDQDRKTRLESFAGRLSDIVFHEKIGTLGEKVARIEALARRLADEKWVPGADGEDAARAARLAKADLVTQMVGEFPELQGIIGGYLASAQGESEAVAHAIRDQYRPAGPSDVVPDAPCSIAVGLADRLDTLVSFFAIGEVPTGSRDPFALRRAALAIIALIVSNRLRLPLRTIIETHLSGRGEDAAPTADALIAFFAERLKVQQREAGVRHDLIDAVFALGGEDDLWRLLERVKALQAFVETDEGANLLAGYKRAANILKREAWETSSDTLPDGYAVEPAEGELRSALSEAVPVVRAALDAEDFAAAMAALARLRAPVDRFFDTVTVNDPDPAKREARLNLLASMRATVHQVADFSRIEG